MEHRGNKKSGRRPTILRCITVLVSGLLAFFFILLQMQIPISQEQDNSVSSTIQQEHMQEMFTLEQSESISQQLEESKVEQQEEEIIVKQTDDVVTEASSDLIEVVPQEEPMEDGAAPTIATIDDTATKPMIALSFDDGPSQETTNQILDILDAYGVKATFFVLGYLVERYPDTVVRAADMGNEIGNHSYNHPSFTDMSTTKAINQITKTNDILVSLGIAQPSLMRPPYGAYTAKITSQMEMSFMLWSVDPRDWESRDKAKVVEHVLSRVKDGDVVLMHDIYPSTVEAVVEIVPALLEQGYQLVTVSELFAYKQVELKSHKVYRSPYYAAK